MSFRSRATRSIARSPTSPWSACSVTFPNACGTRPCARHSRFHAPDEGCAMGYLLDGVWKDGWYDTGRTGGNFVRPEAQFHDQVTADGSSGYPATPGRYHLYGSLAC